MANPQERLGRFYGVSERPQISASIDAEQSDLAKRENDLASRMMTRLAWHFALENFRA